MFQSLVLEQFMLLDQVKNALVTILEKIPAEWEEVKKNVMKKLDDESESRKRSFDERETKHLQKMDQRVDEWLTDKEWYIESLLNGKR